MPTAASVLGVDALRGWLHLAPAVNVIVRAALVIFVGWTAARSLGRDRAEPAITTLALGLGAALLLAVIAAGLAALWAAPSSATDVQEWALLYACPMAGATGLVAAIVVLAMEVRAPPRASASGFPLVTAASLVGLAGVAYGLLRFAGVLGLGRVAIPLGIGAMALAVLSEAALDVRRAGRIRVMTGALAAGLVALLALL